MATASAAVAAAPFDYAGTAESVGTADTVAAGPFSVELEIEADVDETRHAGEDLEPEAALVLAVALGAGLGWWAVVVLRRRPQRGTGTPSWTPPAIDDGSHHGAGPYALDDVDLDDQARAARRFGNLLEGSRRWIHRRVESIEFLDDKTIRRRVSVDFTLPDHGDGPHRVPLALLEKRALTRFDLRDESGASLSLLTTSQTAPLVASYMIEIARRDLSDDLPDSAALHELCLEIAAAPPREARAAIRRLATSLEPESLRRRLVGSERFRVVTNKFAAGYPIVVQLEDGARRRVVKFAYDEPVQGVPRLLARLGLAPAMFGIDLPELGDASSHHVEFREADALEVVDVALVVRRPGRPTELVDYTEGVTSEGHLYVTGMPRGTQARAGVWLRVARQGLLAAAPMLAVLAASAITGTWFALPEVADRGSNAATLLLAVPAALGAYLWTRGPHRLVARMLLGARVLTFVSAMLSFVVAGALALELSVASLRWILGAAAVLSWAAFAGLIATYLAPDRGKPG